MATDEHRSKNCLIVLTKMEYGAEGIRAYQWKSVVNKKRKQKFGMGSWVIRENPCESVANKNIILHFNSDENETE